MKEETKAENMQQSGTGGKPVLGEVPTGNGVGGYAVIGSASNVIAHLNSLIHSLSFGANPNMYKADFINAAEAFDRLGRHFT